jgi:hypothetical protein
MTDQELQDLLDRLGRDGGAPANTTSDASVPNDKERDLKAYRLLYAALEDEPDGDLPSDFAQQVANRVMPAEALSTAAERFPWLEWVLPPLLLVAAFVATLLLMPTVSQSGAQAMQLVLNPLASLWIQLRLDIALMAGTALLVISFVDRFVLRNWFQRGLVTT